MVEKYCKYKCKYLPFYNKNCVLYPRTWVDEINFGRFICVINYGPCTSVY